MKKFLLVGAGFSNAVIARELAEKGYKTVVIDSRSHVAGNCHSERCLLYTSPSPRDRSLSRMPSSA